jgi:cytochrome P450
VVEDLADFVPVRVAEEYFGLPNPGQRALLEWIQLTSWYIFNPFASGEDRERAMRAGTQMAEHVRRLVRNARSNPPPRTVLAGLLATSLGDEAVARTLTGLVAGSLGPPPRFFVKAVNQLLGLRGALRGELVAAAKQADFRKLEAYLLEAARIDPDPSLLYRACERDSTLAGQTILAGDTVVCFIQSALRDGRAFDAPRRFRLERPGEDRMLFGHGLHECIGREVGMTTLVGMALPLFARPGLRRAPGKAGDLRAGPADEFPAQNYPQHLGVLFER